MKASKKDTKLFHSLIQAQRKSTDTRISINGKTDSLELCEVWKNHFEYWLPPQTTEHQDTNYLSIIDVPMETQIQALSLFNRRLPKPMPLCTLEVIQAMRRLNKGKASDQYGLSAEHLIHADTEIAAFLTSL